MYFSQTLSSSTYRRYKLKARDLLEASDLTKQDLTEQDILNEDQGVWIGSFQSNGRKQFSHN
jgi:hypothetical protein